MKKTIINTLTISFLIFVSFIIFAANTGVSLFIFDLIGVIPMGDKIAHMVLIGLLALLINLSLKNRTFKFVGHKILVGSTIVFCLITIEEFSQIWITRRTFDLLDLTFNYLGIYIANWIISKIK